MSGLQGLPADAASIDSAAGAVSVTVDEAVYPLEAVYGAAYVFIDRCYVLVDRPQPARFRVTIAAKQGDAGDAALRAMAGELLNELLSCAWRQQIAKENRAVIESVTMQAIGGAMGPASLDELAAFDFTEEPFEDPLGIAMSWEDKYKKKGKEASEGSPPATPEASGGDPGSQEQKAK